MSTQHHQPLLGSLTEAHGQINAQELQDDSLFPELAPQAKGADPMLLWGSWPGDEPIEELMAMLD